MKFHRFLLLLVFFQIILHAQQATKSISGTLFPKVLKFSTCSERPKTDSAWLEYSYSNGTVFFHHVNAYFNCATHGVDIVPTIDENKLRILEREKRSSLAGCGCFFDIQFQISGIKPGLYEIELTSDDPEMYPNRIHAMFDFQDRVSGAVRVENLPGVIFTRPEATPFFLIK